VHSKRFFPPYVRSVTQCISIWQPEVFSISILTGFRDHSLYKGHQVFLYKRAQIFVADLWGAFKGQNYGEFHDINSITIFADYIVPAVLRELGILKYGSNLSCSIDSNCEIVPGSEEEVEIRACSIYAVEKMRDLISKKFGKQVGTFEPVPPETAFYLTDMLSDQRIDIH
jgi:hypothetical protein